MYNKIFEKLNKEFIELENGTSILYYKKGACAAACDILWNSTSVIDFRFSIREWSDGVHASCFFSWIENFNGDEMLNMASFDCYV